MNYFSFFFLKYKIIICSYCLVESIIVIVNDIAIIANVRI